MAPSINYRGDLTYAIQVRDINASVEWYQSRLGFEELFRHEEGGWCEVKTSISGVTIGFSQVEEPLVSGGATLVFGVEDIEATRSKMEKQGVKFEGDIVEIPGLVKLTTFYDLNGHKYMFSAAPDS